MLTLLLIGLLLGDPAGTWRSLAPLPDREGFACSFAGVSRGALLVAGGANFPDLKPWEGGKKVWYDRVFVLENPDGAWKVAGPLPRPLAYGVSVSHREGLVCIGGSDADQHRAECFRLEWDGARLITTELPSLPRPLANACGALVGETFFVAGGQEAPDARTTSRRAWKIDLAEAEPRWREIEPLPGRGRMLAVAAGCDGAFWVVGGGDLVAGDAVRREYLRDSYRYDPDRGWTRVADLPHPVAAAPSPAPADAAGFRVLGGDDGSQVGVDPGAHTGFRKDVLRFELATGTWSIDGAMPDPRVTAPCVHWRGAWVVPSGEVRPGVRSPRVDAFVPAERN